MHEDQQHTYTLICINPRISFPFLRFQSERVDTFPARSFVFILSIQGVFQTFLSFSFLFFSFLIHTIAIRIVRFLLERYASYLRLSRVCMQTGY